MRQMTLQLSKLPSTILYLLLQVQLKSPVSHDTLLHIAVLFLLATAFASPDAVVDRGHGPWSEMRKFTCYNRGDTSACCRWCPICPPGCAPPLQYNTKQFVLWLLRVGVSPSSYPTARGE